MCKTVYALPQRPSRLPVTGSSAQTATECNELLDGYIAEARKHGVPPHKTVSWIRRKIGGHIVIVRYRKDGTLGCAVPCVFCQRELVKFDIHIHCITTEGSWFSGRLDDSGAPQAVFTTGQRRMMKIDRTAPRRKDRALADNNDR